MKIDPTSIFSINNDEQFNRLALSIFKFQAENNSVYKQFLAGLKTDIASIDSIEKIPFLPISFFKTHKVTAYSEERSNIVFTSSSTTGTGHSFHFVHDISLYEKSYCAAFQKFYGNINEYCILALLPSYLERDGSSLIYMMNDLINQTNHPQSNFYLNNTNELLEVILELNNKPNQKTILLGVTYALLDLAKKIDELNIDKTIFENLIVMETGGMKGKRKEMIKEQIHSILKNSFVVHNVHSEYGMTELLSQAYAKEDGLFYTPPWMKVFIRDVNDPFTFFSSTKTGGINIIDLANIYSCSFIATQDLGKKHSNNSFEILGRFDNSDIRGCNLLIQ